MPQLMWLTYIRTCITDIIKQLQYKTHPSTFPKRKYFLLIQSDHKQIKYIPHTRGHIKGRGPAKLFYGKE